MLEELEGRLLAAKDKVQEERAAFSAHKKVVRERALKKRELDGPGPKARTWWTSVACVTAPFHRAHVRATKRLEDELGLKIDDAIEKSHQILKKVESLSEKARRTHAPETCQRQAESIEGLIKRHPERTELLKDYHNMLMDEAETIYPAPASPIEVIKLQIEEAICEVVQTIEAEPLEG